MPSRLEADINTFRETWHEHLAKPLGKFFHRKIQNWVDSKIYQMILKGHPHSVEAQAIFDSKLVKSARDFSSFTIKVNTFNFVSLTMIAQVACLTLGILRIRGLSIAALLVTALVREAFDQTIADQNQEEFTTTLKSVWKSLRFQHSGDQRAVPCYIFFKEHLNMTEIYSIAREAIQQQEDIKQKAAGKTPPASPIKKT